MDWKMLAIVVLVIVAIIVFKRMSFVPAAAARQHLQQGAMIVDVRSPGEFRAGHLRNAVNIPLDELQDELPRRVADRNQVLLLHCLSGTRSGIARRQLLGMGYSNVFNLGSYQRAKQIVGDSDG